MKYSIKLFSFYGTPIYLKIWFFLLLLILPGDLYTKVSMFAAIFISVLIHEMAHTIVAKKLGYGVGKIYIDIFNGAAEMETGNIHESDSAKITAAGPMSNLILFLLFYGISMLVPFPKGSIFESMIWVNKILFIFNMIPIYPMDGGRLTRDLLTLNMKSRLKAKNISLYISLISCIGLFIFIFMTIFSIMFEYLSLKDLNLIK